MEIQIVEANHNMFVDQTFVKVITKQEGTSIPKGTIQVEFFKYFSKWGKGDRRQKIDKTKIGELPAPPKWIREKYPGFVALNEMGPYLQRMNQFKESNVFKIMQKSEEFQKEMQKYIEDMPDGYIIPQKIADEFCNCPIPSGETAFYFTRVFPQSVEPWDFIRVVVRDQAGTVIAKKFWSKE